MSKSSPSATHAQGEPPQLARLRRSDETLLYRPGTELNFSASGNAAIFETEGWNEPEKDLTWTSDKRAAFVLPMKDPCRSMQLAVTITTFSFPNGRERSIPVTVWVNGTRVADWTVRSEFEQMHANIPREAFQGHETAEIAFDVPDTASPRALGIGADQRTLGVAITTLMLK